MPWKFRGAWISLLASDFVVIMHKNASHYNGGFQDIQRDNLDTLLTQTHKMKAISQDYLLL